MIDFTVVTGEFRSLVGRRRALLTYLGSIFAGLGIFAQNVLQGHLPPALQLLERHLFAAYGSTLLVVSAVLALRVAKLHAGMTREGILYARLLQEQEFTPAGNPVAAARHNFAGVSFLMFLLAALLGGFSAVLLGLACALPAAVAALAGVAALLSLGAAYAYLHAQGAREGLAAIAGASCAPYDRDEWQAHVAASLDDVNQDMLGILGFVALVVFSAFEGISNLGAISASPDLSRELVVTNGPLVFCLLMAVVGHVGLLIHLRLRLAQGHFSLQLDGQDRPFDPLRLTDSFLGYALLAFLSAVALFVLVSVVAPPGAPELPFAVAGGAFVLSLAAEKLTLIAARRRIARQAAATAGAVAAPTPPA